jgi:diaminopimelate epimerase
MKFVKMHGTGNDFIVVDCLSQRVGDASRLARRVCNRRTGIGADGLILITPPQAGDARMEIFNADGSRPQMCGNGIRCVGKYLVEHTNSCIPCLNIETDAGTKTLQCAITDGKVNSVRVDMGQPSLNASDLPAHVEVERLIEHAMTFGQDRFAVTGVSMGNPHAIVFVEDVERVDLAAVGPSIENAAEFPERINAHFVQVTGRDRLKMKSWERGAGATRACGTGACAAGVAACVTERTGRRVMVCLPGGDLDIEWGRNEHVYMTGPAVEVFSGEWPG